MLLLVKSVEVESVRAAMTADSRAGCAEVCCNQPLHSVMMMWREVTPAEVRRTVLAAAAVKSCSLDPILTYLLCDCIHALLLCSMTIVNISLHEACRPMPEYQTNSFSQRTDVITQQKNSHAELADTDVFLANDNQRVTLLASLYLSAKFDLTVNDDILLHRMIGYGHF